MDSMMMMMNDSNQMGSQPIDLSQMGMNPEIVQTMNKMFQLEVSDSAREKLISQIINKKTYAYSSMSPLMESWKKCISRYRMEEEISRDEKTLPKDVKKPHSGVKTPLTYKNLEALLASYGSILLKEDFNFIKVVDPITGKRQYQIENLLYNTYIDGSYGLELIKALKSMGTNAIGYVKLYPDHSSKIPRPVAVNSFSLFLDPYTTELTPEGCGFLVHQYWMNIGDIVEKASSEYFNQQEVTRFLKENGLESNEEVFKLSPSLSMEEVGRSDMRNVDDNSTSQKFGSYKVYEYWDRYITAFVLEEKYLLRVQRNAFGGYPFYSFIDSPAFPEEYFVKSKGEYLQEINKEMDVKHNQRIDNVNSILRPPVMYVRTAIDNPELLKYASGNKIPVNSLEGIKEFVPEDATSNVIYEEASLKTFADDIIGIGNSVFGEAIKKERLVASESQALYSAEGVRLNFGTTMISLSGIVPLLKGMMRMFLLMGYPNVAPSTPSGKGIPEIVPVEALLQNYRYSVQISPNKYAIDSQNAMTMYQILRGDPSVNHTSLVNFLTQKVFTDTPDDLLTPPPGQIVPGTGSQGIDNKLKM